MSYRLSYILQGTRKTYEQSYQTLSNKKIIKVQLQSLRTDTIEDLHTLPLGQLEKIFETNCTMGLTENQAKMNLERYGLNVLLKLQRTTRCKLIRNNLCGTFQCLLWITAFINFAVYVFVDVLQLVAMHHIHDKEYLYLGLVTTVSIIFTGIVEFFVENKNESVMSEFDKMIPTNAVVIRQGFDWIIPTKFLTVGDIVDMKEGDMVPADCRILTCLNFSTETYILTGQSEPVYHVSTSTDPNPSKSKNMCFFGCPVVCGVARAMVVAVGANTQLGKIAGLVTGIEKEQTPISKEIYHFVMLLCIFSTVLAFMFFILFIILSVKWSNALQATLGVFLANVPESLIVTLTIVLTASARQLKEKNCLVKTLQAVETLGATSCICSDKTGTLTQNVMTVSHLFCNMKIYDQSDRIPVSEKSYTELCIAACLNMEAYFGHDTIELSLKKRRIVGDATESGILRYMEANRSASLLQTMYPLVAKIRFNSRNMYQVSIHRWPESSCHHIIMKGAPEIVLSLCSSFLSNHGTQVLTPDLKREIKQVFFKLANMGERVIGYGDLILPEDEFPMGYIFNTTELNFPMENFRFLGAISLVDEPRKHIEKYIGMCRNAGIRVTMATGDHPVTALAISRKCGTITHPTAYDYALENHIDIDDVPNQIKNDFQAAVFTGDDLRQLTTSQFTKLLERYREITFARINAQQKMMIAEGYQRLGLVVAVTGNGVNDSPALKKADIGIAMGITGNEVSKLSADMILLDDNFASIIIGVREGRRIYDNLKKSIAFTLASNTSEIMPFILYTAVGIPLPFTLMLVLVMNAGTNLIPAISLAYEKPEDDIMNQPPRKSNDRLVTGRLLFMAYYQVGMVNFFAGMFVYFTIFAKYGFLPSSLFFVRPDWESIDTNVRDSTGADWSYVERKMLERKVQTAYFVTICLTQVSDVIICKTRRVSILQKEMNNHVLNMGIMFILMTAVLVTYLPGSNTFFNTVPIAFYEFFLAIPFVLLMILSDELRRYFIRNNIFKWIKDITYY